MPLKIFYVDDEIELCEIFKELFERENVIIECFTDPEAALKRISESTPNIVFLDFRLPGTTGEIISKRIPKNIPRVLLTGDLNLEPGANFLKVFTKPFEIDEINTFIDGFLKV